MKINSFDFDEDIAKVNIYEKEYMEEFADEIEENGLEELRDYLIRE